MGALCARVAPIWRLRWKKRAMTGFGRKSLAMPANSKQLPTLGEISGKALDQVLALASEPAWLSDSRRAAWKTFQAAELPVWRRTNLQGLSLDLFRPTYGSAEIAFTPQEGLFVRDLATALRERPDLMDGAFGEGLNL